MEMSPSTAASAISVDPPAPALTVLQVQTRCQAECGCCEPSAQGAQHVVQAGL